VKTWSKIPQECVYCGTTEASTKDHVPPKCLFPKSARQNLIRVPACEPCNNSAKLDDEYFRAVVSMASEDSDAVAIWKRRVFTRASLLFKKRLIASLRPAELLSQAGLHLRYGHSLKLEKRRIEDVVIRIVRGLLWHHHQVRTGEDTRFDLCLNPKSDQIHEIVTALPISSIGGTVFQYRHGIASDDAESSVWHKKRGRESFLNIEQCQEPFRGA
jgi:hypothetical protein